MAQNATYISKQWLLLVCDFYGLLWPRSKRRITSGQHFHQQYNQRRHGNRRKIFHPFLYGVEQARKSLILMKILRSILITQDIVLDINWNHFNVEYSALHSEKLNLISGRRRSLVLCFFVLCVSCLTAMLCKLYSGCVPEPNESCEVPELDLEECNEVMLETSKVMAFIGKFAVAGMGFYENFVFGSFWVKSTKKPVSQFCTLIRLNFIQLV